MSDFVHLHVHTEYSLLDGVARILSLDASGNTVAGDLIEEALRHSFKALAITDHGNLFGVLEFYLACRKAKLKPIIGSEFYLASRSAKDQTSPLSRKNFHLTVLAKNNTGFRNLMKLSSYGYTDGFYYKPRIDEDILFENSEGLVVLSGCLHGKIPSMVLDGDFEAALEYAKKMKSVFGKDFYIELMNHDLEDEKKILPSLVEIARRLDLKTVATNDVHYARREDAELQDVALAIGTRAKLADEKRFKMSTRELFLKSGEEMAELFREFPEAIETTAEVAEKCNVSFEFDKLRLPAFRTPSGEKAFDYLNKLCWEGIKDRYGRQTPEIKNRLDEELGVIRKMGFSSYFLIVWDFINYARKNGIAVGPGRGSGAGSIVSYLLKITDIDPLKYGLLFERFLNPGRITMPDLDIDFEDARRDRVIEYVKSRYGEGSVGQIITFNQLKARGAIRDVGRVMGVSYAKCDKIAKLIPAGETVASAAESVSEIKQMAKSDPEVAKVLSVAGKMEGLKRHFGVHAAGVVITPGKISQFVPLAKSKTGIITQFEGDYLIKLGLLKMDFLGLKTLTVINDAVNLAAKNRKAKIDIKNLPLDDKKTFDLLGKAKTVGVFQVESEGMRDILRKMKPSVFTDLSAVLALYRPGPIKAGMVDEFIERKHGRKKYSYPHPALKDILEETYGVILYQEQVMLIAKELAGFSLEQADILRKAMGKKVISEIEEQKENFISGCRKNGVKAETSEEIFNLLVFFGSYGFNKSHSTAYAVISYQTAYLKANYPLEFMVALLNSVIGDEKKISRYLKEAEDMSLKIIPPDINESETYFSPRAGKEIVFGLLAVKNTGEKGCDDIVDERRKNGKFANFEDFMVRFMSRRSYNKRMAEFLLKAGAFSKIEPNVAGILEDFESALSRAERKKAEADSGQISLFVETQDAEVKAAPKKMSHARKLKYEKEALGFYLTGHPLTRYEKFFRYLRTSTVSAVSAAGGSSQILIGIVKELKHLKTKKDEEMFVIRLEDLTGVIEVVGFVRTLPDDLKQISEDEIIAVKGTVSEGMRGLRFFGEKFYSVQSAFEKLPRGFDVYLKTSGLEEDFLKKIANFLKKFPGPTQVNFILETKKNGKVKWATEICVKINSKLIEGLEKLLGENCWKIEV
ncbi:MAG: DNA polymerase III subunit alpha [Elusimicrobia bacterium]|nr:DNA polymerase III subunit alpha [Elusimicrobiota bacterium]